MYKIIASFFVGIALLLPSVSLAYFLTPQTYSSPDDVITLDVEGQYCFAAFTPSGDWRFATCAGASGQDPFIVECQVTGTCPGSGNLEAIGNPNGWLSSNPTPDPWHVIILDVADIGVHGLCEGVSYDTCIGYGVTIQDYTVSYSSSENPPVLFSENITAIASTIDSVGNYVVPPIFILFGALVGLGILLKLFERYVGNHRGGMSREDIKSMKRWANNGRDT